MTECLNGLKSSGIRQKWIFPTQALIATSTILANNEIILISATAATTLGTVPIIANGLNGQLIKIINIGANVISLRDQGTLVSSNLRLTTATLALGARDSIDLIYLDAIGDWLQVGVLVNVI